MVLKMEDRNGRDEEGSPGEGGQGRSQG